jgi:glutathione-regulated potassium-efflux system protein KefB
MMTQDWLTASVVLLGAAVVSVSIAQRLGAGAVLGYLLAGVVIGPWGLGWFSDVDAILHFSEFGVVLLLFLIGLELNPSHLWQMRKPILGLGGAQVVISTILICLITKSLGQSWIFSMVVGMGMALSSTAIALRVLDEQGLMNSTTGQSGFAVLLFQDIAVIPMLALLPMLTGQQDTSVWDVFFVLGSMIALVVGGHFLLRPLFRWIVESRVRELFNVAALLLVLGIALIMKQLGLSMALGAFLAGILLAESEFRHELETAIEPFKGLLLGLFFIAVGMTVDLSLLWQFPHWILFSVIGLVLLKMTVIYALSWGFGLPSKSRSQIAVILSQGGEFAFVLFASAKGLGLFSIEETAFLLVVVSLSMMTTPLLLKGQMAWFSFRLNPEDDTPSMTDETVTDRQPRVILTGFGRFGQVVGRLLYANKIRITILERDPAQIAFLRRFGYQVYYGDATQLNLLRAAGAETAEAIVICTDDPDEVMVVVAVCQRHFPHLKVLARARSRVEAHQLLTLEVDGFARETLSSALDLGRQALVQLGMHPYQAKRARDHFYRLDKKTLRNFMVEHGEDVQFASRSKEARKELEELFDNEMQGERARHRDWDAP